MSKILIIGSSYTIKNTFKKKYLIDELTFLDFRQLWDKRELQQFDKIKLLYKYIFSCSKLLNC